MTDNNSINIGGVKFNKNDVAKSEVIKQDGKVFISGKNEVKQNNKDITYTPTGKKGLMVKSEMHKGKGTIKK